MKSIFQLLTCILAVQLMTTLSVAQEEGKKEAPKTEVKKDEIKVKVLEAGAEPRQELRFSWKKGQKQILEVHTEVNVQMKLGDFPLPGQKIPVQVMTMETTVTDVKEDGLATLEFKITKAVLDEGDNPNPQFIRLRQLLEGMKGLKGTSKIDNRGFTKSVDIKVDQTANAQLAQQIEGLKTSLQQISNPFPKEPVGAGAKWEVKLPLEQNGIKISQSTVYELKSFKDGVGDVVVKVKQTAENQKIDAPGAPPGTDVMLKNFNGSGSGQSKFSLTKVGPISSSMKSKTGLTSEAKFGEQTQTMNIDVALTLTIYDVEEKKKADAKKAEGKKEAGKAEEKKADKK